MNAEATEPYFQVASAILIIGIAFWMLWRTYKEQQQEKNHHSHAHDEIKSVDTGHGVVQIEVFEKGVPPRFRLHFQSHNKTINPPDPNTIKLSTTRSDGAVHVFALTSKGSFLESVDPIPEPHEFTARLSLHHGDHAHDYDVFFEEHHHGHDHAGLDVSSGEYQDAHELAHANDIKQKFANKKVTTGQIVMFGLTGGLIPCPASITILLLCLQLKKFTLGMTLVLCFSIGLAMTMILSGTIAALSVKQASKRWSGFGTFARRAPYLSSALIICVGLYTGYIGVHGLMASAVQ